MRRFVYRWVINSLALLATAMLFKDRVHLANPGTALVAAAILGIVNATLKPLLILLTLPLSCLTLGLFTLVVNGITLRVVDWLVPGFDIAGGLFSAMLVALVLSLISMLISGLVGD